MMPKLQFPNIDLQIREESGSLYFWDIWRKKEHVLSPEEWVRQHVLFYFRDYLHIPESLMAVEREIRFQQNRKRFDVLVYDTLGKPLFLTECKAPHIDLNARTIAQISVYNQVTDARFLLLTNGIKHLYLKRNMESGMFETSPKMYSWEEMLALG